MNWLLLAYEKYESELRRGIEWRYCSRHPEYVLGECQYQSEMGRLLDDYDRHHMHGIRYPSKSKVRVHVDYPDHFRIAAITTYESNGVNEGLFYFTNKDSSQFWFAAHKWKIVHFDDDGCVDRYLDHSMSVLRSLAESFKMIGCVS